MRVAIIALNASLAVLKTDLGSQDTNISELSNAVGKGDMAAVSAALAKVKSGQDKLNADLGPINTDMHPDDVKKAGPVAEAVKGVATASDKVASAVHDGEKKAGQIVHPKDSQGPGTGTAAKDKENAAIAAANSGEPTTAASEVPTDAAPSKPAVV